MQGLLITTLVSLAVSQSYAATECPAVDGPLPVYIPNPADCGTYYQCVGGKPLLLQCPVGTHWSTIMNRCDFPENAKCEETGANPTSRPTTGAPESEDPPKKPDGCPAENGPEDVLLPNPDDCGSFYKCLNGIPYLIECPPDQEWSTELSRCDWPEIAQCSESGNESNESNETTQKPETDPEDPPNTPDGCPAENGPEDVLLPNPDDCGSFYKCLNGIPYLIQCPPGQEWSVELSRCDWPEIANCSL